MRKLASAVALLSTLMVASQAHAYVGPGVGLGAIGAVLGVILSLFLAVLSVFYYPLKRWLKKRKGAPPATANAMRESAVQAGDEKGGRPAS